MKGAPALGFRCRFSPMLLAAQLAVTTLALCAIWLVALPHWLHALAIVLIAGYAGASAARLLRPRVSGVLWRADGTVEITLRDTPLEDGRVLGAMATARVLGPLIVLTLRWPQRERAHLWLLPDNLDADTRRRLRMRLATGTGVPASGNADSG